MISVLLLFTLWVVQAEYIRVPGGFLANEKCVSGVPSGSHVTRLPSGNGWVVRGPNGELIDKKGSCGDILPNPENSWQDWTSWHDTKHTQIDSFVGYMVAPKLPKEFEGDILYIFPGLQNVNWIPTSHGSPNPGPMPHPFDIIQPVLQYNYEGNSWFLKNWYVGDDHVWYSDYIFDIAPGTEIWGNMTRTGPDTYYLYASVNGKKTEISVTSNHLQSQAWAYTTIEKYGGESCKAFPYSDLVFKGQVLTAGGETLEFEWEKSIRIDCVANITTTSQAEVTYAFAHDDD